VHNEELHNLYILRLITTGCKTKVNIVRWIEEICSTQGNNAKCIHNFSQNQKGRKRFGDISVRWRMILK
jgi:hypothetical protein